MFMCSKGLLLVGLEGAVEEFHHIAGQNLLESPGDVEHRSPVDVGRKQGAVTQPPGVGPHLLRQVGLGELGSEGQNVGRAEVGEAGDELVVEHVLVACGEHGDVDVLADALHDDGARLDLGGKLRALDIAVNHMAHGRAVLDLVLDEGQQAGMGLDVLDRLVGQFLLTLGKLSALAAVDGSHDKLLSKVKG